MYMKLSHQLSCHL